MLVRVDCVCAYDKPVSNGEDARCGRIIIADCAFHDAIRLDHFTSRQGIVKLVVHFHGAAGRAMKVIVDVIANSAASHGLVAPV